MVVTFLTKHVDKSICRWYNVTTNKLKIREREAKMIIHTLTNGENTQKFKSKELALTALKEVYPYANHYVGNPKGVGFPSVNHPDYDKTYEELGWEYYSYNAYTYMDTSDYWANREVEVKADNIVDFIIINNVSKIENIVHMYYTDVSLEVKRIHTDKAELHFSRPNGSKKSIEVTGLLSEELPKGEVLKFKYDGGTYKLVD